MNKVIDTLIVGAGISGLTLAHTLHKQKKQILLAESQNRVGGNITTGKKDGFCWEEGPNSFAPNLAILKLATEVGLKDDLLLADRHLPRFVYWQNKLHPVPMNPHSAVTSNLLSFGGKFRALLGALGFVSPIVGNEIFSEFGEETVRQFFLRHLGKEVTERLVSPFVSGVFAGDVDQLAAKSAFRKIYNLAKVGGGLVPGAILTAKDRKKSSSSDPNLPKVKPGELGSFKDGLERLPQTIAANLKDTLKLNWQIINLQKTENKTYIAEFNTPEGLQTVETRSIVLTTPAHITTEILKSVAPVASESLKVIPYPPVACVVLAYPENATIKLRGFGNLIPRGQGIRTLGSIWTSTLFPGKTPPGWVMITNFIGGATDLELGTLSDDQIVQCVHEDLKRILLVKDVQPKVLSVHLWKKAIPQYNLGHQDRLDQLNQDLQKLPGVYICTNYTDGVALGDCIQRALDLSEVILKHNCNRPVAK